MPDLDQHRCNRTVYSRSGAASLAATGLFTCHFVRKIPDVEQHRCYGTGYGSIDTHLIDYTAISQELSLSGGREILRSEQEVNTLQIWSNTSTICGLIRSQDSIIQIWSNTAAQRLRVYSILRVYSGYRVFFVLRVLSVLEYWRPKYSEYLEYEQYWWPKYCEYWEYE